MAGTDTMTSAWKVKNALYEAAIALWKDTHPEVQIEWGEWPGTLAHDDQLWFTDVEADQEVGPLSASNRAREETITVTVELVFYRPGEIDAARDAEQALYARLGEFEYYVRKINTTLAGLMPAGTTVRHCFLVRHRTTTVPIDNGTELGALAAAAAEFRAVIRITQ